jgi:hypothetical protein
LAYLFDHTGGLMAGHYREVAAPLASDQVDIAVTNCRSRQTNFHFAWLRWVYIYVFNNQGLTKFITDSSFHCPLPLN